jgi:hypothetical protein
MAFQAKRMQHNSFAFYLNNAEQKLLTGLLN